MLPCGFTLFAKPHGTVHRNADKTGYSSDFYTTNIVPKDKADNNLFNVFVKSA